jgi:hypothetical protein
MVGSNIGTQPSTADVKTEVNSLIDQLSSCSGAQCSTVGVAKGACASVLGSAAMLVK